MRILKVLLVVMGSVIALLILAAGGLATYAAIDKQDTFFLQNAELSDPDYLRSLAAANPEDRSLGQERFSIYSHRLKRGKGTIFAYRFYSNGSIFWIDDEAYRKLTVWIASPPPRLPVEFNLRDKSKALVLFSHGSSAWPRNDCSGYIPSGSLRIERSGSHYTISVRGQLEPHGNINLRKDCDSQQIDTVFRGGEFGFEKLMPWLGIAGLHPYDETYR